MNKASAKSCPGRSIDTQHNRQLHRREKTPARFLDMASSNFVLLTVLLALVASGAIASDPGPLQDFCVADKDSTSMYFV